MSKIELSGLSLDELIELRGHVERAIARRVQAERRDLEARLRRLDGVDVAPRAARDGRVIGARAVVAPKYQNPADPEQTWSGRGRKPRWLTAALKSGKRLRDFEI